MPISSNETYFEEMGPSEIKKNTELLHESIKGLHTLGELENPDEQVEAYVQGVLKGDHTKIFALYGKIKKDKKKRNEKKIMAFAAVEKKKIRSGVSTRGRIRPNMYCHYVMYVKALVQNQGYGTKVMEQTLSEIKKWTKVAETTEVFEMKGVSPGDVILDAKTEIHPFYEKLGFHKLQGTTMIRNAQQ